MFLVFVSFFCLFDIFERESEERNIKLGREAGRIWQDLEEGNICSNMS